MDAFHMKILTEEKRQTFIRLVRIKQFPFISWGQNSKRGLILYLA